MTIKNICSSCGGELFFDFDTQELKCSQCGGIVEIPDTKTINDKKPFSLDSTIKQKQVENLTYTCENCGKTCVIQHDSPSLRCVYCGSVNLNKYSKVDYVPDGIVPFKLNKERAKICFIDWIRKKRFLPSNLKKRISKSEFFATYVPVYNYDIECSSLYKGVGINYSEDSEGRKTSSYYPFSGTKKSEFKNYLESASSSINSNQLKSFGNFSFNELYVFRTEYLYGVTSLEANIDLQQNCKQTQNKISNIIERQIKESYHYDEIKDFYCETHFEKIFYNHLYVPVWLHTFRFNKKDYSFFINGSTGKVSGKAPKSAIKILLTVLGFILGAGALALLIYLASI